MRFKPNPPPPAGRGIRRGSALRKLGGRGGRGLLAGTRAARVPGRCVLGVIWVPRKLPGKGLPGAAPSIVSSARGTTAIAWRRKETQTREKEGSAKPGRAGDGLRGCCLGRHLGPPKASPSPAGPPRSPRGRGGPGEVGQSQANHSRRRRQTPAQVRTCPGGQKLEWGSRSPGPGLTTGRSVAEEARQEDRAQVRHRQGPRSAEPGQAPPVLGSFSHPQRGDP